MSEEEYENLVDHWESLYSEDLEDLYNEMYIEGYTNVTEYDDYEEF